MYELTFYATIAFTVIGAILGLIGVWFEDFFRNDIAWRLIVTDIILAVASAIVATITKFLG